MKMSEFTSLLVYYNNFCNMSCVYCPSYKYKGHPNMVPAILSYQDFARFLSINPQIKTLNFTGGEPFVSPDFTTFLTMLLNDFPYLIITILTNGTIVPEQSSILSDSRITIIVTCSSHIQDQKAFRTGGEFNDVIANYNIFKALNPKTQMLFMFNINRLPSMADIIINHYSWVDNIRFRIVNESAFINSSNSDYYINIKSQNQILADYFYNSEDRLLCNFVFNKSKSCKDDLPPFEELKTLYITDPNKFFSTVFPPSIALGPDGILNYNPGATFRGERTIADITSSDNDFELDTNLVLQRRPSMSNYYFNKLFDINQP